MESTYGDSLHKDLEPIENMLYEIINQTCNIKKGKVIIPAFSVVDEHPLLLDYAAQWLNLYVSTATRDSAAIVASIGAAVSALVNDWRPASHYLNGGYAQTALEEGFGLLLRAPQPIVEAVKSVLEHHDVRYSAVPLHGAKEPMRALIAGTNWVIAHRFRTERR